MIIDIILQLDILSIHTKLSDRTKNIISEDEINLMQTSSYIINTSRGPIIEENALVNALNSKKIAGAAIDTFDIEPLPNNHKDKLESIGTQNSTSQLQYSKN